ncbi:general stress protein [Corynebacterium aquilae]|uniref:general stress protein n=1 Tax=Corynebacterium aquilae TaxID=203263 RepID=UPI00095191BA|nr:general stress protein [Corynebacterium aquilae]
MAPSAPMPAPRSMPTGWPVGSFETYEQAQQIVNELVADPAVPPTALTIVGLGPMEVEHVVAPVTWVRLLFSSLVQSVALGMLIGLVFGLTGNNMAETMASAVAMTVVFGLVVTFVPQLFAPRRKKFLTRTELVATRYDVLCDPEFAPHARDLVAAIVSGRRPPESTQTHKRPGETTGRPDKFFG